MGWMVMIPLVMMITLVRYKDLKSIWKVKMYTQGEHFVCFGRRILNPYCVNVLCYCHNVCCLFLLVIYTVK